MALAGRWNLQDSTPTAGSAAVADSGNDGEFVGGVTWQQDGGPGGYYQHAVNLNGTTGGINIGTLPSVRDKYSLCLWVKEEANASNRDMDASLITRQGPSTVNLFTLSGSGIEGSIRAFHSGGAGDFILTGDNDTIRGLGWTHYALTFDGTEFVIYKNAQALGSTNYNTAAQFVEDWKIGTPGATGALNGPVVGAAVYSHALNASEVTSEYNRAAPQFVSSPTISGVYAVGEDLTVNFVPTDGDVEVKWFVDQTSTTYSLTAAEFANALPGDYGYRVAADDVGKNIYVKVTLTNAIGSNEASTPATQPSVINEEYQNHTENGDILRRSKGAWRVTQDTPIYVADMEGENFDEQFQNALSRLQNYHGAKIVNFPDGGVRVKEGLVLADPSTPSNSNQLMNQVVFRGGRNTRLFWDESVADSEQLIMLDIPAAYQMRLENITLRSRYPNGIQVGNKIGIYHHAAWDWNTNTARGSVFESIVIDSFEKGLYVGSPAGPDITLVNWNNCLWTQCQTGVVVEGANVAGYVFSNCQIGTSKPGGVAWRLKYAVPKYFDGDLQSGRPQYQDVWGNPLTLDDLPDTPTFLARLQGSEPDKSTIGGGPDIAIRDCNVTVGDTTENAAQYAIVSESASVYVDNLRIEGSNSAVLKTEFVPGSPNFHLNRFRIVMREVNCVGDKIPYDLAGTVDQLAGYPVEIIGGHYNNDELPASERKLRRLITRTGDIRGPVGLTVENPELLMSYQMDGPTGSVTTLADSSGNNRNLTVLGSGGELVAGSSGQGNAFDVKGTAYAELDAASTGPVLNELQEGTISLRFKINSLATTDEQFAGLLSRRSAETNGWALTLDGHNDSLRIRHDNGTLSVTLPNNEQLQVGQWYHLAMVMLGDGKVTFWLDGKRLNTASWSFPVSANSEPLQIGIDGAYTSREFNGLLDDIRVYDVPLGIPRLLVL